MQVDNMTEVMANVSNIPPAAARAAGSYVGEAIDGMYMNRILAKALIGTLAGAGTLAMKFQHNSGSVSSDSNWADIDSVNCITSTFTSLANNSVAQLELRAAQHSAILRYIRPYALVVTSTWIGAVVVDSMPVSITPATDRDAVEVIQTVVF